MPDPSGNCNKEVVPIFLTLFNLCGGLVLFLYGMSVLSHHLEQLAGSRANHLLSRMTSTLPRSLLSGAGITIILQSSSAMTVLLVGLVNSGVIRLSQTVGLIMGSNIGTTLTPWLLSLTGLESTCMALELLKPQNLSVPFALLGVFLVMLSPHSRSRLLGHCLVGFSLLMFGMEQMSQAVAPLAELPYFSQLIRAFQTPLQGFLIGTLFTGIIQSSAASIGILQALAMTGSITWAMAIPIILGQNVGTCVTALLASIGASRSAKHVALLHILFNLFGTAVCMLLFLWGSRLYSVLRTPIDAGGIALCHTLFNLLTTCLLLPLFDLLETWVTRWEHHPSSSIHRIFLR